MSPALTRSIRRWTPYGDRRALDRTGNFVHACSVGRDKDENGRVERPKLSFNMDITRALGEAQLLARLGAVAFFADEGGHVQKGNQPSPLLQCCTAYLQEDWAINRDLFRRIVKRTGLQPDVRPTDGLSPVEERRLGLWSGYQSELASLSEWMGGVRMLSRVAFAFAYLLKFPTDDGGVTLDLDAFADELPAEIDQQASCFVDRCEYPLRHGIGQSDLAIPEFMGAIEFAYSELLKMNQALDYAGEVSPLLYIHWLSQMKAYRRQVEEDLSHHVRGFFGAKLQGKGRLGLTAKSELDIRVFYLRRKQGLTDTKVFELIPELRTQYDPHNEGTARTRLTSDQSKLRDRLGIGREDAIASPINRTNLPYVLLTPASELLDAYLSVLSKSREIESAL